MTNRPQNVEEIFWTTLGLDIDRREAFLDEACGDDAELRKRVEDLLRAHNSNKGFLPEDH